MSGTSADGVDTALIEVSSTGIQLIDFQESPLSQTLKNKLLNLNQAPEVTLSELCQLHKQVADIFIEATLNILNKNQLHSNQVIAIGSHGQTIFHASEIPMTLQIGHPAFIAKQTGIMTVADFRVDDMALGGQGAPFAPAFHQALFPNQKPCFAVNIGGIANISYLPGLVDNQIDSEINSQTDNQSSHAMGWDTGPGNALMDEICQQKFNKNFDKDGLYAKQGSVNLDLLSELLTHPYFSKSYPKSTGRDTFNLDWVNSTIESKKITISQVDLIATLCELTAITISQQIQLLDKPPGLAVWIVGGGAYNAFLISRIQYHLPDYQVASSQTTGIHPNAVEAMLCAWLAKQRLANIPIKLSAVTGAERDAVLGGIWHP